MLRAFNAFQLTSLFAGMPYLIGWLAKGPFPFSVAAMWTAIIIYAVLFVWITISMAWAFNEFRT